MLVLAYAGAALPILLAALLAERLPAAALPADDHGHAH